MSDAIKRLRERAAGHAEKLDQSVSPIDYTAIAKRDLTALLDIAERADKLISEGGDTGPLILALARLEKGDAKR